MSLSQWKDYDFQGEINKLFAKNATGIARDVSPLDFVTEICFQSVVGWAIGLPAQMTLIDLGFITTEHNRSDQITEKGRAFIWWRYRDMRQPVDVSSTSKGE